MPVKIKPFKNWNSILLQWNVVPAPLTSAEPLRAGPQTSQAFHRIRTVSCQHLRESGKEWAANQECLPADVKEEIKINFYKKQILACYYLECYLKKWKGNLDACIKISNQWVAQPSSPGILGNASKSRLCISVAVKRVPRHWVSRPYLPEIRSGIGEMGVPLKQPFLCGNIKAFLEKPRAGK